MYRSLDRHQKGLQTIISNNIVLQKDFADKTLDLSLSKANEIKISIMSSRAVPPSFHMDLNQIGSMSSKMTLIKSYAITQVGSDKILSYDS